MTWGLAVSPSLGHGSKGSPFPTELNFLIHSEKKVKLENSQRDTYSSPFLWSSDVPRLDKDTSGHSMSYDVFGSEELLRFE